MERYFEWDTHKAASNIAKHNIEFDLAAEIFDDPFSVLEQDRVINGEERWKVIGRAKQTDRLLLVACTFDQDGHGNEIVRIISARRANKHERALYEHGQI